jgi:alkanesulfonate monooxygenase SsuD/methylene tetrahydromethanopterin reductase-like flavin-dependent oxidoreductase (luciferase family)
VTRLRIGLRFDLRRARDGAEGAHLALLDVAVAAEACGLDVAWIAESAARADSLVPAALPVCAALAARTVRLRVATGLLPLPLHHPLRVAEDAAVLDALSGGRFELGVGPGREPAGASSGAPAGERAARFLDALGALEGALAGAARGGEHPGAPPGASIWPPPQQPGGPPLWIGASGPRLQRAGARLGAGLLLEAGGAPDAYLAAWRAEGPSRLAWLLPDADPAALLDASRACLRRSAGADSVDLVLAAPPLSAGSAAAVRAVEALGDRVAPALRAFARA